MKELIKKIFRKNFPPTTEKFFTADVSGQVAVITGASGGIGSHLALALARTGAKVVLNYRQDKAKATQIWQKIKSHGGQGWLYQADISQRSQVEKMIHAVKEKFGRIDLLINNAAVLPQPSDWQEISEEDWEKTLTIDLKGVFEVSRAVGRVMFRQKRGKIINISSLRGLLGGAETIAYSVAKAGVDNLTKSFAKALAPFVTVNGVSLGRINVGLGKFQAGDEARAWQERTLLKKVGQPSDVVGAVMFLASSSANFITGQVLVVDGGASLNEPPFPATHSRK